MCGRYTQTHSGKAIASAFSLDSSQNGVPSPPPRYNIAPTQPVSAIAQSSARPSAQSSGQREYRIFQWGLIPAWAKDPSIGSRMINARAETVAEKPSFRTAFKRRRCLIVADGFYEWKKSDQKNPDQKRADQRSAEKTKLKKQPYYIQMADKALFGMAGIWESWESGDGSYVESCTILTTDPNALMQPIHNRMPVIIHPSDYDLWLDPTVQKAETVQHLLRSFEADAMQAYPVSRAVNSPRNESADCVEPIDL
ncbi:MAG: SOS response-associated peptidase [Cyanobacteria bacterium J06627_28]